MAKESTNPIGPGTAQLTVNVRQWLHAELSSLAAESGMKLTAYVRGVLVVAALIDVTRNGLLAKYVTSIRERETALALIEKFYADPNLKRQPSELLRARLQEQLASSTSASPGGPGVQHPVAIEKPTAGIARRSGRRRTIRKKNQP